MNKWRVNCGIYQAEDVKHPGFEVVTADTKFVSGNGVLSFFRIVPEPEPEPVALCCAAISVTVNGASITCVRPYGHPGKHMDKLKPKWPKKPKLIGVRDFNAPRWDDCVLVEE